jgi:hypothetical protein
MGDDTIRSCRCGESRYVLSVLMAGAVCPPVRRSHRRILRHLIISILRSKDKFGLHPHDFLRNTCTMCDNSPPVWQG